MDTLDLRTGPLAQLTDGMSSTAGIPRRPKMPSVEDAATLKPKSEIVKPAIPEVAEAEEDEEPAVEVDPDSQEDVEAFLSEDDGLDEVDEPEFDEDEEDDASGGTDSEELE